MLTERNQFRVRWLIVVVFAAAMAWVESAAVFYLRTMIARIELISPIPCQSLGASARSSWRANWPL